MWFERIAQATGGMMEKTISSNTKVRRDRIAGKSDGRNHAISRVPHKAAVPSN